jgi:hypothetical protein
MFWGMPREEREMTDEKYYMIDPTDHEVYVTEHTAEEIAGIINDEDFDANQLVSDIPDMNAMYWEGKYIIIKGQIIKPVAEEVVTRYRIP